MSTDKGLTASQRRTMGMRFVTTQPADSSPRASIGANLYDNQDESDRRGEGVLVIENSRTVKGVIVSVDDLFGLGESYVVLDPADRRAE